MLHEAFNEFRVHGFAAENPFHFFLHRLYAYGGTIGAVPYIGLRSLSAQTLYGGNHTAMEGVVVIGT